MSNKPKKPIPASQKSAFITPPNELDSPSIRPNIEPEKGVLSALEESNPPLPPSSDTSIIDPSETSKPLLSSTDARFLRLFARALLVIVAIAGIGWLFWQSGSALMPFVIGSVLGYLLLPVVNRLNNFMPRWAAILVVYIVALIIIVGGFAFIIPPIIAQAQELIASFPDINTIINQTNKLLNDFLSHVPNYVREPIDDAIRQGANTLQENLTRYLQNIGTFAINSLLSLFNTVTFLFGFLVIPFWLFYLLMDHESAVQGIDNLLPRFIRRDFWAIMHIIDDTFTKYIGGQIVLGFAVGACVGIGLLVLQFFGIKIPYILLLAIFAGVTELIPVIGPIIGAVPALILALFTEGSVATALLAVAALYILVQQLENQLLVPRIVGESVGIHPAILMVLLIACSTVFGLLGAILAAPVSAVARDIFNYLYARLSEPTHFEKAL